MAPSLIRALLVKVECLMKQVARLRNDLNVGLADGLLNQCNCVLAEKGSLLRKRVQYLGEDHFASDDPER